MVFTEQNSFVLTMEGKVYSWGMVHSCLGRDPELDDTDIDDGLGMKYEKKDISNLVNSVKNKEV
jgi:hypothetical protein